MDFNDMIHRVTVEDKVEEQDQATGEMRNPWQPRGERWARVKALAGRDAAQLYQAGYLADVEVKLRYEPGIVPLKTRINYGGVMLNVVHVNNVDGRNVELLLSCKSDQAVP
jgi:SPP1 family predicted phage head-tail adaptor